MQSVRGIQRLENKQNFERLGITTLITVRDCQSFVFHKVQVWGFPCFLHNVFCERLRSDSGVEAPQAWWSVDDEVGRDPPWERASDSWIHFIFSLGPSSKDPKFFLLIFAHPHPALLSSPQNFLLCIWW